MYIANQNKKIVFLVSFLVIFFFNISAQDIDLITFDDTTFYSNASLFSSDTIIFGGQSLLGSGLIDYCHFYTWRFWKSNNYSIEFAEKKGCSECCTTVNWYYLYPDYYEFLKISSEYFLIIKIQNQYYILKYLGIKGTKYDQRIYFVKVCSPGFSEPQNVPK